MSINSGDLSPVSKPMYRLSRKAKAEVERQLADLVKKGVVRPSPSAWGAHVIFVGKEDWGTANVCRLPSPQPSQCER